MSSKRAQGDAAEAQALAHLEKQGLRLLKKNYHCRRGEIDLVMQDGGEVVFVEVRHRAHMTTAIHSIDGRKQQRIGAAAAHYLSHYGGALNCRFDVVLTDSRGELQWIKQAFEPGD